MRRLLLLCVLLATVLTGLAPAGAGAAQRPRPDLAVTKGGVALSGSTLTGSFTVKAQGRARAGRSVASLTLVGPGAELPVATYDVPRLKKRAKRTVAVSSPLPTGLAAGTWSLRACADATRKLRQRDRDDDCRIVGQVVVAQPPVTTPTTPTSSVPTRPVPFTPEQPFLTDAAGASYWTYVPTSYDASHQTPTKLLIWMHGCGGESEGDTYLVSPGGSQDWISVSLGGRDGDCWDVNADPAKVLAALADVKTHFNIAPRQVVIGGYSSGGDLAYRTAFYNAKLFAGVIAENTSPFRDTGSGQAQSLAAASWKFNVWHLAHTDDEVYQLHGVKAETAAMNNAGFPLTLIERPGTHYDDPGTYPGTDADLRTYLLPALGQGWLAPAS
ncbi:hypothetical protein [Nocardioides flavescens]|uniref:Uncharacterized protein n=1 Tax=Nocardioides flavescens TaxID=2691959 RepID=A0A6L7F1Q4_9ACTN|nr:hypothetical protein [Nocardioides flavescens]MXG88974.1 hypothetical protein [Nocardioides flavescens]